MDVSAQTVCAILNASDAYVTSFHVSGESDVVTDDGFVINPEIWLRDCVSSIRMHRTWSDRYWLKLRDMS